MNLRFWLPLTLCLSVFALDAHGDPACGSNDQPKITSESAVVEDVLTADHGDYQYRDYIVRWHGNRVAVTNPMAISRHDVGDTIGVVVSRRTNAGDEALRFTNIERYVPRAGDKVSTTDAHESINDTGIGTVEEVLRAEDDPFHYVAYIVKWQDSRIAITDNAPAHFGAGDSIEFAISGNGVANHRGLMFFLIPKKEPLQRGASTTIKENGTIDAVLTAQADGLRYVSYFVNWHGQRVAVNDYSATTHYAPKDPISFTVTRMSIPTGMTISFDIFSHDPPPLRSKCERPTPTSTPINPSKNP